MQGRIHSQESFGTVDGPGVRYVVFMQGCPLRCMYCHNPDTWVASGGTLMTAEEILAEYDKKKAFYSRGGLTVTGGEPLLQIEFVTELFEKAKEKGIHTCLDTSGITFREQSAQLERFDRLIAVTDLVLLDIKNIFDEEHITLTGQSNLPVLAFARYLSDKGIPVWIRHVVVPGITDRQEELEELGRFLARLHNVKALDVLPYHTMGEVKYEELGVAYPLKGVPELPKEEALRAREIILGAYREARIKAKE